MQHRTGNWIQTSLAAVLLGAVAAPVLAQDTPPTAPAAPAAPAGRQGRARRNNLPLVNVPIAVMDMISPLTDEQKTKIQTIQDKEKTDFAAAADRPAKNAVATKASDDIKALLTPDQTSAVAKATPMLAMLNQSRTIPVAALPDVKLTKDQMTKISALVDTEQAKIQGVAAADRQAKMAEVNADFKTQVEALLTTEQKDALAKYQAAHPRANGGGNRAAGGNGNAA